MKRVYLRAVQLAVLTLLTIAATPRHASANELGCYAICAFNDWECIFKTGHPADPCAYDTEHDICNLGGCTLEPYLL